MARPIPERPADGVLRTVGCGSRPRGVEEDALGGWKAPPRPAEMPPRDEEDPRALAGLGGVRVTLGGGAARAGLGRRICGREGARTGARAGACRLTDRDDGARARLRLGLDRVTDREGDLPERTAAPPRPPVLPRLDPPPTLPRTWAWTSAGPKTARASVRTPTATGSSATRRMETSLQQPPGDPPGRPEPDYTSPRKGRQQRPPAAAGLPGRAGEAQNPGQTTRKQLHLPPPGGERWPR